MTNALINLTPAHIAFIEALRVLLFAANADEAFARQDCTFGEVAKAIRSAIADALLTDTDIPLVDAADIAHSIYSAMIDSGEDTDYCIRLWNEGRIDRDFRI